MANDLGNLLNRCATFAEKFNYTQIQAPKTWSKDSKQIQDACAAMIEQTLQFVREGLLHRAVQTVWEYIALCNAYFHNHEPWKLAKITALSGDLDTDKNKPTFQEIIAATAYSLRAVAVILLPVMPKKMQECLQVCIISYQVLQMIKI